MLSRPDPGAPLVVQWRKWDGTRHWEHDCVYLGADEWGDWVGQRAGWRSARPGREETAGTPNVSLLPPSGDWAFTRNAAPARTRTYIDLAWDVRFDGQTFTGIDMDLDVADRADTGVYIDDEDEWHEHRVRYGYPAGIVARLESLAVDLERRVRAADPPFDDAVPDHWFAVLARLAPEAEWAGIPRIDG